MTAEQTRKLIERYYAAFNEADITTMLACLRDDVVHIPNQGQPRHGKSAFQAFMDHMNRCYRENLSGLVVMTTEDGRQAAATFTINGEYLVTDEGLPEAAGQRYELPVAANFWIEDNQITKIANHYNLADWIAQVSGRKES